MRQFLDLPARGGMTSIDAAVLTGVSRMTPGQHFSEQQIADNTAPVVKDFIRRTITQYADTRGPMAKLVAHQILALLMGERSEEQPKGAA